MLAPRPRRGLANPEPRARSRSTHAIAGIGELALLQRQASAADALRDAGPETLQLGFSSTGDDALDALLPFDEPYDIPASTAALIGASKRRGGRVIAIGTSSVRALEHAANGDGTVRPGFGIATQRIGPGTRLRVVDAIVSGTHEQGTSHYELLRAFQDDAALQRMESEGEANGYRTHEFGDSVLLLQRRT